MRDLESEACQECGFYGEPNGCNRLTGTCSAYHLVLELQTENAKLRAVVEATKQFMNELDFRGKTHSLDMGNYHGRTIHIKQGESGKPYWLALWSLQQALAELDKEGER